MRLEMAVKPGSQPTPLIRRLGALYVIADTIKIDFQHRQLTAYYQGEPMWILGGLSKMTDTDTLTITGLYIEQEVTLEPVLEVAG